MFIKESTIGAPIGQKKVWLGKKNEIGIPFKIFIDKNTAFFTVKNLFF